MGGPVGLALRELRITCLGVIAGGCIFLVIAFFKVETQGPLSPGLLVYRNQLLAGVAILAFACLLIAKRILAKATENAKESINTDVDKLNIYRVSFVRYLFITELPVLVSLVLYLLTGSFPFLALGAVILGLLIAGFPAKKKLRIDLDLDEVMD